MPGAVRSEAVCVSIRRPADGSEVSVPWGRATTETLSSAAPWRTFRWHDGQQHFSGTYWSATEGGHVIYESRLELARLLFADFDASVNRIVAQPFLLKAGMKAGVRRHVPDFLLVSDAGPTVVDVKPLRLLSKPEAGAALAWTRELVEGRGWRYEVWSEPPEAQLSNLRFLAGFRRDWLFDGRLLEELCASELQGVPLGKAFRSLPGWPEALVRSAIFHLLWTQRLSVDLTRPLSASHVLANGVRS